MDESEIAKLKLGTCAWSYDDWAGTFYPEHLPAVQRLEFYARHFSGVEVDSTFYHPPAEHVARHWAEVTPDGFTFALKLTREITHERKLRDCSQLLEEFVASCQGLGDKLGCVLVQLPPYFTLHEDEHALREFVIRLPRAIRWAIEFRHADWHLPRIVHLFEEHDVCWVWPDVTSVECQAEAAFDFLPRTTDFLYLRLLGDLETKYHADGHRVHHYRKLQWPRDVGLENWLLRMQQTIANVARVLVFSGNHFEGFAPETVLRFAQHVGLELHLPSRESLSHSSDDENRQLELL